MDFDAVPPAVIEELRVRFVEKFSRSPGPGDPLFFDPDCDEPRPMTLAKVTAILRQMDRHLAEQGINAGDLPAIADARAMDDEQMHAGRNEPCPCGSGAKFKRCHGA